MMKALISFIFLLYSVTLSSQERITLLFVGDLMQHRAQIDAARTSDGKYDYSPCFSLIKEEISRADIAIGNLEVTLGGKPYQGYPTFSAPDEYLQAIKDAGFDVLLTANNHCLDRGKTGLERTITQIESFSIPYAGTYRNAIERKQLYPLFIRKKGFCIAILNYTYGTNGIKVSAPNIVNCIDKKTILKDIHSAQAVRPDAIIACMHWGEEYQSLPNREQCELADWLLKQGVTHIIGSHPHVTQPMELRTNGNQQHAIVYSLGNFISNMSAANTDGGLIFTLQLEKYPLPKPIRPLQNHSSHSPSPESFASSFPFARVVRCGYTLVWTGRPTLTGEKNYILYPSYSPHSHLPQSARNRLNIFIKNTRKFLVQHNTEIYENNK